MFGAESAWTNIHHNPVSSIPPFSKGPGSENNKTWPLPSLRLQLHLSFSGAHLSRVGSTCSSLQCYSLALSFPLYKGPNPEISQSWHRYAIQFQSHWGMCAIVPGPACLSPIYRHSTHSPLIFICPCWEDATADIVYPGASLFEIYHSFRRWIRMSSLLHDPLYIQLPFSEGPGPDSLLSCTWFCFAIQGASFLRSYLPLWSWTSKSQFHKLTN